MPKMHMKVIAIKIGSSVLFTQRNKLDEFRVAHIADQLLSLRKKGIGVILVVSGAVAGGANSLGFSFDNEEAGQKAAGVGQAYLISVFQQIFSQKNLTIAQVLLTHNYLKSPTNKKKISRILHAYIREGIIPVINENDVIDLNSFGGNDFLVARIATLLHVQHVLILSTMSGSLYGVGGGYAKQQALTLLEKKKIPAVIIDGKLKNSIVGSI